MTASITLCEYSKAGLKDGRNLRLIKPLDKQVKTSAGRIRRTAVVDKLNEDYDDKYLDRHQFLDHLCKSIALHTTVVVLNYSVIVLLIFPAHPVLKYSPSE